MLKIKATFQNVLKMYSHFSKTGYFKLINNEVGIVINLLRFNEMTLYHVEEFYDLIKQNLVVLLFSKYLLLINCLLL